MGDINNYINTNFNRTDINNTNNEIDTLLNIGRDNFETCNFFSDASLIGPEITIFGVIGFNDFINTTVLIPNLFRVCYSLDKLLIPNICNQFIDKSITKYYLPKILDENTIKSILYYNVPSNTKDSRYFQDDIIRVKIIKRLKKPALANDNNFNKKIFPYGNIFIHI